MVPGNSSVCELFGAEFSNMSGSTQTSQADLCYVKRCYCVLVFFPASREKRPDT